jgi:hypothetical protein
MRRFHLAVAIATGFVLASPVGAQSSAFTPAQRAEGEAQIQTAAKYLAATLRDPSSATFRNVFIQKRVTKTGEHVTVCGEINGRNGFGGFTGFQAFIFTGGTVDVGIALGMLDVGTMCRNKNPIVDTRDYTPEMKAAYTAALSG